MHRSVGHHRRPRLPTHAEAVLKSGSASPAGKGPLERRDQLVEPLIPRMRVQQTFQSFDPSAFFAPLEFACRPLPRLRVALPFLLLAFEAYALIWLSSVK